MVECHGGAWCMSDRTTERLRHEYMASHGIVSIALDFRSGNEAPYPASVQDINYAVRWAKANARMLKTRPDLIGLSGQSSGGHLAMLVAMRPHDPRYAAIALPAGSPAQDASVRCVIMSWPVINPLSRYRHAKRAQAGANPPEWPKSIIARHDSYWRSEANMAEGSPTARARGGEKVQTPPAIWYQAHGDIMHDYKDTEVGVRRQRAAALLRRLSQGRRLDRARIHRHGAPSRAPRRTWRSAAPCSGTWSSSWSGTSGSDRAYGGRIAPIEERTWQSRSLQSRKSAAKKAAAKSRQSRKSRTAGKKATKTRKPRAAEKKAAATRKKRAAAKKAVAPRRTNAAATAGAMPTTELDNRIAILRNNLRDLVEQAASYSGAADEERMSQRIAEQETKLKLLVAQRDERARR